MAHPGLPITAALLAVPVAVLLFVLTLALLGDRWSTAEEPPPAPIPPPYLPPPYLTEPAGGPSPYGGSYGSSGHPGAPAYPHADDSGFPYIPDEQRWPDRDRW